MITLFHRPKTRSSRVMFLLEELEAPYQRILARLAFARAQARDSGL